MELENNVPYLDTRNDQLNAKPMTVKEWLVTLIITAIPIVGLVMAFIWAFGNDTNLNKKNFFKAWLLMMAIGIGIAIVLSIFMFGFILMLVPLFMSTGR